jgi:hypothetical protein
VATFARGAMLDDGAWERWKWKRGGKRAQVVVRRVGSDCACSSDAANTSRADLFAAAVTCIANGRRILF